MVKLKPTNDYIFKRIFGKKGNEKITKDFIETMTGYTFENVVIEDTQILEKDIITDKLGILDVKVSANNVNNIDIEMQVVRQDNIVERILWYWSKLYSSTLKSGQDYDLLKRTICILIADFEIDKLKCLEEFYTRWRITNTKHSGVELTDKLDIVIIELSKMDKKESYTIEEEKVLNWCNFLRSPEKMEEATMEENENIKAAKEELDKINMDKRERELAELREKAIRDEIAIRKSGYREGLEEGIKEGMKEGIEKGINKGSKNEKINIAKNLLKEKINIELISKATGLSIEEIEELIEK